MAVSFVDWKGANANTLAGAMTVAVGDTCVIASFAASATPPSLPAGYTSLGTLNVGSTIAGILYWRVATSTSENGGTATGGTTTTGIAYRGAGGPINFTSNSGTSTTPTFLTMPVSTIARTSWVYRVAVDISATIQNNAMTGYTVRDNTTNGVVGSWDSNAGVTSRPTTDTISPGASGTWITFEVEIPMRPTAHLLNQSIQRAALF